MRASNRLLLGLFAACALLTGASAQILIGQPSGFTGSVAAGVKENTEGARLVFDAVNARGGVGGQKIELLSVDDGFDPKKTEQIARDLVTQRGVLALSLNRGTPHAQALLPLLNEYKVPLVGPSTGAMALHEPVQPFVFNVRATYQREAAKAIEHLATLGIRRIGVFQTDDSFGADGAAGALKGFKSAGLEPAMLEKVPREKPDFGPLAKKVNDAGIQAVLVIASAGNTASAVKALRAAGSRAQVVTLSNNASEGFVKLLGEHAHGVVVTQVFPNERTLSNPLIKEAHDLAVAKGIKELTPAMIEGFAAAKVLVEALRRASPNPTREKLVAALNGLRMDLGGLELAYRPTDHTGLDFADLSIIAQDGRFRR